MEEDPASSLTPVLKHPNISEVDSLGNECIEDAEGKLPRYNESNNVSEGDADERDGDRHTDESGPRNTSSISGFGHEMTQSPRLALNELHQTSEVSHASSDSSSVPGVESNCDDRIALQGSSLARHSSDGPGNRVRSSAQDNSLSKAPVEVDGAESRTRARHSGVNDSRRRRFRHNRRESVSSSDESSRGLPAPPPIPCGSLPAIGSLKEVSASIVCVCVFFPRQFQTTVEVLASPTVILPFR